MSKPPPLDPTVQRLATEALAHTGEARRHIADYAKIRGVIIPPDPPTGFEEEEVTPTVKPAAKDSSVVE